MFCLLPLIVSPSHVDLIELCGESRCLYPYRQSSEGFVVLRASCFLVLRARFASGFIDLKASMAMIRFDSSYRFFLLAPVHLHLSVGEDFVVVLGIAVALASALAGLITCRRLRPFYIHYIWWSSTFSHKEIYMDGDAHPKGFSAPLTSSNIGQLGLRYGLNTNTLLYIYLLFLNFFLVPLVVPSVILSPMLSLLRLVL